jgi:hypothetical protein
LDIAQKNEQESQKSGINAKRTNLLGVRHCCGVSIQVLTEKSYGCVVMSMRGRPCVKDQSTIDASFPTQASKQELWLLGEEGGEREGRGVAVDKGMK